MSDGWAQVAGNVTALGLALFIFWWRMGELKSSIDKLGSKIGAVWDALTAHKDDHNIHVPLRRVERVEDKLDSKLDKHS